MAARGQGGTYRPNRRRKHGRKAQSPLRPIGSTLTPINQPALQPISAIGTPVNKPAPAKPTAPVQPLDPEVVNAQVVATRNVGLGDLYANFQQGNLDQEYGFGAGGAANPYSKAKLLEESFRRAKLGTTNSYASQGQLYSSAYGRMQNENQRNYDISYDQLQRQYTQQSGDIQFGRLQNYADAGTGVDETTFQSLLNALRGL